MVLPARASVPEKVWLELPDELKTKIIHLLVQLASKVVKNQVEFQALESEEHDDGSSKK